jgi:hypothetical protein
MLNEAEKAFHGKVDEKSSLLCFNVSEEGEKFYDIGTKSPFEK